MQKIASERTTTWIGEAFSTLSSGLGNIVLFAALPTLGLIVLNLAFSFCSALLMGFGSIGVVASILQIIVGIVANVVPMTYCTGVALAHAHGRAADWDDVRLDLSTHVQAIISYLLVTIVSGLVMALVAVPGIGMVVSGFNFSDNFLITAGFVLVFLLVIPAALATFALTMFTIPLIVDRRLDFWSAFLTSVDCARRDLWGLLLFCIVLMLVLLVAGIVLCPVTLCMPQIMIYPLWALIIVRVYRDYFGLDVDHVQTETGLGDQLDAPQVPVHYGTVAPPPEGIGNTAQQHGEIARRQASRTDNPDLPPDVPPPPPEVR